MKKISDASERFSSHNTCQHNGRVFHFFQSDRKLVVAEAVLGDKAELVRVETRATLYCSYGEVACCSLGQRILVMCSDQISYSAALVSVGEGRLSKATIHVTDLAVSGDTKWPDTPFLCQVAENRALLYFHGRDGVWYCDVADKTLFMRKHETALPAQWGLCTVPIRLPDGKLLVAGLGPTSTNITLITANGKPASEKLGSVPGAARYLPSTVLVRDRFVVGSGSPGRDELWVFDLQTRRSSQVRKEGEWHPADHWVPLVVRDGTLYLVGGRWTGSINSLSLSSLAGLIVDTRIKERFRRVLGLPLTPFAAYTRKACRPLLQPPL